MKTKKDNQDKSDLIIYQAEDGTPFGRKPCT